MFDLLKKSPNITVEGQGFNGRFAPGTYVGTGPVAVESWYQPKGEFKIQYRAIMGRGGESALMEATCFSEGSGDFIVSIPPSDIHKDNPDVRIELAAPSSLPASDLCAEAVRALNIRKDN